MVRRLTRAVQAGKFRQLSTENGMLAQHLHSRDDSVTKSLCSLRTVFGNIPDDTSQVPLRGARPNYSVSHAANRFLTSA
jgi:hypothetical protein